MNRFEFFLLFLIDLLLFQSSSLSNSQFSFQDEMELEANKSPLHPRTHHSHFSFQDELELADENSGRSSSSGMSIPTKRKRDANRKKFHQDQDTISELTKTTSEEDLDIPINETIMKSINSDEIEEKNFFLKEFGFTPNFQYYIMIKNVIRHQVLDPHIWLDREDYKRVYNTDEQGQSKGKNFPGLRSIVYFPPDEYPVWIQDFIEKLNLIYSPDLIENLSVIYRDRDTQRQESHVDYPSLQNHWPPLHVPLIGIIALEDNVNIFLEGKMVKIPKFDCLIFKGNTFHFGGNYDECRGARMHFYIESNDIKSNPKDNAFESQRFPIIQNPYNRSNYSSDPLLFNRFNCLLFILSLIIPIRNYIFEDCKNNERNENIPCPKMKYIYQNFKNKGGTSIGIMKETRKNTKGLIQFLKINLQYIFDYLEYDQEMNHLLIQNNIRRLIESFEHPHPLIHFYHNQNTRVTRNEMIWERYIQIKKDGYIIFYELYLFFIQNQNVSEDYEIYFKDYSKQNVWKYIHYTAQDGFQPQNHTTTKGNNISKILKNLKSNQLVESLYYRKMSGRIKE